MMQPQDFKIVICFHDADEPGLHFLETHLATICREGLATIWHRGKIIPGEDQRAVFESRLQQADVVLLLISADFTASCGTAMRAVTRLAGPERPHVIPVVLRSCVWSDLSFFRLRPIPSTGDPLVVEGRPVESRFYFAAQEIREAVIRLRAHPIRRACPPTATQKTIVETLARLEQERHALESLAGNAGPSTIPGRPPDFALLESQGLTFDSLAGSAPAGASLPPTTPASVEFFGHSGTIMAAPLSATLDATSAGIAPAVDRLRTAISWSLGDVARGFSVYQVIEAAAALLESARSGSRRR